ncbi:unnamed protein product [Peronospora belbahrii]|uniref:Transcriptional coactivator p15 (PC4) C-terminal domain-containing protein n=1 Tax=Peronospora belbahrii TaxID=622444 RepID=A0AAU9LBM9_9STRA|nr:unnamed protein product [Peronospora belbahrii]CAH0519208.1 unnamed protein product [Peronospora belbahrii]
MSTMPQAEKPSHKRPVMEKGARKRVKISTEERPSLTQMLSRQSGLASPLSLSQTSDKSTVSLARLIVLQTVQRAVKPKEKTQQIQQNQIMNQCTMAIQDVIFQLSTKRRVTIRKWKSMKFVDIREFYDEHGNTKPGKKGLSLVPDEWKKLYNFFDAVTEAIELVEENQVGMIASLNDIPGCILKPNGDVRAIALPLSNKRRITVRYFRNGVLIDLREFYEQNGMSKPGKKGISLSKDQWMALQEIANEITKAIDSL